MNHALTSVRQVRLKPGVGLVCNTKRLFQLVQKKPVIYRSKSRTVVCIDGISLHTLTDSAPSMIKKAGQVTDARTLAQEAVLAVRETRQTVRQKTVIHKPLKDPGAQRQKRNRAVIVRGALITLFMHRHNVRALP